MNWYKAELDSKEGLIPSNYIEMKSHEYVYIIHINKRECHFDSKYNTSCIYKVALSKFSYIKYTCICSFLVQKNYFLFIVVGTMEG